MAIFYSYVSLPEGNTSMVRLDSGMVNVWGLPLFSGNSGYIVCPSIAQWARFDKGHGYTWLQSYGSGGILAIPWEGPKETGRNGSTTGIHRASKVLAQFLPT